MVCHNLRYVDEKTFVSELFDERNIELTRKIVKSIFWAIKKRRKHIKIFKATFNDYSSLFYEVSKDNYIKALKDALWDIAYEDTTEDYLLCVEIRNTIQKLEQKEQKSFTKMINKMQQST